MSAAPALDPEAPEVIQEPVLNGPQQKVMEIIDRIPDWGIGIIGFGGSVGGGKALSIDTPIPTPDGWVLNGDLRAGDYVLSELGKPIRVLAAHPVETPARCYQITFDDGTSLRASGEHLWWTYTSTELGQLTRRDPEWRARRRERRPSRALGRRSAAFTAAVTERNHRLPPPTKEPPLGAVRSTDEIAATLRSSDGRFANHAMRVAEPLDLPDVPLPLDPYVLGLWLGDGTSMNGQFTTADEELVIALAAEGFDPRKQPSNRYGWGTRGLMVILREMGLLNNKHVPAAYLRASRAQRLALLQGLMDTDGTVAKGGGAEFTTTKKVLADAVHELIVSLGWKARIAESRATLYGRDCGPKFDIKWTPSEYVFRLSRKVAKQRLASRRTTKFRYVVACEPIAPEPMRCITVDSPTGLYLAGKNMAVTHNSFLIARLAIRLSIEFPGNRGLIGRQDFVSLQTSTLQEFDKLAESIPGLVTKKYDSPPVYRDIRLAHWPAEVSSRIYFRGLENWAQLGSEQFGWAAIDEASETDQEVPVMLLSRMRHPLPPKVQRVMDRQCRVCKGTSKVARCAIHGNTIGRGLKFVLFAASNPWPGWFEDWFLEKTIDEKALAAASGGVHFVPSRIKDNAHNLPPHYEAQLRATYSEADRRRLIEGEWGVFEGAIYGGFDAGTHEWLAGEPEPKDYVRVIGGLDFGNENAQTGHYSAGVVGVVMKSGRIVLVAEFKERGPDIAARQQAWMLQMQQRWAAPLRQRIQWRADRSQMVGIQMMRQSFMVSPSKGGNDSVDAGIKVVASRLQPDGSGIPGLFYLPSLVKLKDEMRKYHRETETMKVVKKNDDLVDSLRYCLELVDEHWGDPNQEMRNVLPTMSR